MKKILTLFVFIILFLTKVSFSQMNDFDLNDLDGNSIQLSELLKKGPVFLQFWATWCVPCKDEMKVLNVLHEKYKDSGFVFVAVSIDDQKSVSKVKPYIESKSFKFTTVYDSDKRVFNNFGGQDLPFSVFIDRNGNVIKTYSGYILGDESKLESDIKDALKTGNK